MATARNDTKTTSHLRTAKRAADASDAAAAKARRALKAAVDERRRARDTLRHLVLEARAAGRTHVDIAAELGITPQGAKAIADRARR